ncbi:MAG: type II toxin-antitoxin system VapC family toxin [Verrucomicrobia bacterium]|nr:type II toxin-antitoxin system VapC family toxin [Verrucomicrobiota bacterium]MCH8528432.1 type II toxin-antitoxin system VapC family toxin [Kiritimatiellia bacterium]
MNVLIDTSVVVRYLLGEANSYDGWGTWVKGYVSELARVEFFRVMDRLRLEGALNDIDRVNLRRDFDLFWKTCHCVPVSEKVLERASESFPTVVGTLDAIHLSTLLLIRERVEPDLMLLTHDTQLARAALASGVDVRPALEG